MMVLFGGYIYHYETKLATQREGYLKEIQALEVKAELAENDAAAYKFLYAQSDKDINKEQEKTQAVVAELNSLKEEIAYSKEIEYQRASRGAMDMTPLTEYAILSVQEMNEWIASQAPSNSPFIGEGEAFLIASQESGLSPKYILAHAALESEWGNSEICRLKNNFFGINATNINPTENAKEFDSFTSGIVEGAKWIARNYTNKGQDTLQSMIFGSKAYAQYDDGSPNDSWIGKVESIMSHINK